jgi:hypothetical protein
MAIQPMALGVANPEINAVSALAAGQQARQSFDMNNIQIAKAGLETIGSIALGSMGGKIDGQADPALFNEGLDYLAQNGIDVTQFRDRADLAPVIARSSMTALQQMQMAQDERSYQLALDNFELEVMNAAQGPAPTAEMRNFDWAAGDPAKQAYIGIGAQAGARPLTDEERATWGIPATDTRPYSVEPGKPPTPIGGAGQTITVNAGGADSELDKALSAAEGKQWNDYKAAGTVSAANAQDFQVLDELIGVAPQGAIPGRLASMFPGVNASGDAFQSIVKRIAPTLRAPGSGSTSDIEYAGMLQSLPALQNDPTANQMILSIMKAKAEINMQRAEIITQYQNKEMTVAEARAKMSELDRASIITPEMRQALVGLGGSGEVSNAVPNVGDVVDGYTFNGGNPADAASWTKVQ